MPVESADFIKLYEALMRRAQAGGPEAAGAARQAGALAAGIDDRRARAAWTLAADLAPLDAAPRIALARLSVAEGDLAGGRRQAEAAFATAVDEAERGYAAFALGEIAEAEGDPDAARDRYEHAMRSAEAVLRSDPHDRAAVHDLAAARQRLAELALLRGDAAAAEAGHEAAAALLSALATAQPSPAADADLGFSYARMADLALERGDDARADAMAAKASAQFEALAKLRADDSGLAEARAALATLRGEIARRRGDYAEARRDLNTALNLRVRAAMRDPAKRGQLLEAWRRQAALLSESGEAQLAEAARAQARALAGALHRERPDDDAAARAYLGVLFDEAEAAVLHGALEAARIALAEAVRLADARLAAAPQDYSRAAALGKAWMRLGEVGLAARKPDAARGAFERAHAIARLAHEAAPSDARARARAGAALKLAEAATLTNDHPAALAALTESVRLRRARAAANPQDAGAQLDIAVALERVGAAALACGDVEAAQAAWQEELKIAERVFPDPSSENALRFCAVIHGHLAGLPIPTCADHRKAALDALDQLALANALTRKDAALRNQLWRS